MEISLPPELEIMVQTRVASGRSGSASDVVREALELMADRDQLDELRRLVAIGIEQADRGELIEGAEAFEKVREQIRQKAGQQPRVVIA